MRLALAERRRDMKVTVQVVTQTDDGQEAIREVACVERDDLTPATLGLSLAEGKTLTFPLDALG
jgi:hypothetical protein